MVLGFIVKSIYAGTFGAHIRILTFVSNVNFYILYNDIVIYLNQRELPIHNVVLLKMSYIISL